MERIRVTLLLLIVFVVVLSFYKYMVFVSSFGYVMSSLKETAFHDVCHLYNVSVTFAHTQRKQNNSVERKMESNISSQQNKYSFTCANDIYVLVFVHTATNNFDRRQFIRSTWGNPSTLEHAKFKVIFLMGRPKNPSIQNVIQRESEYNNDIAQGSFEDTYENLTYKAIFGLKWALENCRIAKFVLKVDDDVIVEVDKLIQTLSTKYSQVQRTIFCKVRRNGTAIIPRLGKWKVEKSYLSNMKHWPMPFCPGHFVIYTADIIQDLYNAVKETPFLWLDDVYVTGLLAAKAGNITHSHPKDLIKQVELVQNKNTTSLQVAWEKRISTS